MEDYIAKGYARKLSEEEAFKSSPRSWYFLHLNVAVISSNKPNKVAIVVDAAAEHEETSLNRNLLQGPDFLNAMQMQWQNTYLELQTHLAQLTLSF